MNLTKYLVVLCFFLRQEPWSWVIMFSLYFDLFVRLGRLFCLLSRRAEDYRIWFFMFKVLFYRFCFFHS